MIELVLVFCMVGTPDRCIERNEPMADAMSQIACVSMGQQIGQEYLREHPNWRLVNWRCQDSVRHQEPA